MFLSSDTGPADYDFSGTRAIAMLEDHIDDKQVHAESEYSSKKGGASPDLEEQSKKGSLSGPDDLSENQRMASLKRVFKKAVIYSTIFAAIVIIIGEFFHPRMIPR